MNNTPSPLASYGSAGFALVIIQWILSAKFHIVMPDDVAIAAGALLGNAVHTLRQTKLVHSWFVAEPIIPAAPVVSTYQPSPGIALLNTAAPSA